MSEKESKWNEIVIGAIRKLQEKNEEEKVEPNYVSIQDLIELINKGVRVTLNKLVENEDITVANSVGGRYYKLKNKNNEESNSQGS